MLFNPWAGAEISPGVYAGAWVYHSTSLENKIRNAGYEIQLTTGYSGQNRNDRGSQPPSTQAQQPFSIDQWARDHYYGEFSSEVSIGVQGTFIINPITRTIHIAPYIRGAAGFNLNIGALVWSGLKLSSDKSGSEITKFGKVKTQGFGGTVGGIAVDFDRRLSREQNENLITVTYFGFGFKYNFTNGDLIIGMMPKGSFAVGVAGSVEMISGFKF
jgi:hypothetical protein